MNSKLTQVTDGIDSHAFLRNPSSQYVFLYLTDYIRRISRSWFGTGLRQLRVLDWGCGKGQVTFLLKQIGANITSCDIESESSDSSFGQPTPIIRNAAIEVIALKHEYVLPFPDESFDIVLSIGVLEHVHDDLASLRELNRILTPKGLFVCAFLPSTSSWTQKLARVGGDLYHDRFYSAPIVSDLLEKSGFSLLDSWYRQVFPKNRVRYPAFRAFERADQFLCESTPIRRLATNIEFLAFKR